MNENVEGGGITSHISTNIVGDSTPGKFGYVDSYPSLESWTATIAMAESTTEVMAIDEELQELLIVPRVNCKRQKKVKNVSRDRPFSLFFIILS